MTCGLGYTIVCPDRRIRSWPYEDEDEARKDARRINRQGCRFDVECATPYLPSDPNDWKRPPCPGGRHRVEPTTYEE